MDACQTVFHNIQIDPINEGYASLPLIAQVACEIG